MAGGGGAHTMLARLESKMDSKIWNQCQENITLYMDDKNNFEFTFNDRMTEKTKKAMLLRLVVKKTLFNIKVI